MHAMKGNAMTVKDVAAYPKLSRHIKFNMARYERSSTRRLEFR
jgi:hypothetical protein